jgi:hypothetical protein
MLQTGALDNDLSIQTDEHMGTKYLKDDQDPTFNVKKPPNDDLSKDGVSDKPPDASEEDPASILTLATQQSIAHKKRFNEEFAHLKGEHQSKMEACQKAQKDVQDQQEAQFATSLKAMKDLQLQMTALQAQQTLSQ